MPPERWYRTFGQVVAALDQAGELATFRTEQDMLLVALYRNYLDIVHSPGPGLAKQAVFRRFR